MKVSSKGQITIPIALRERFGLNPGTEVEFVASGGALLIKPCMTASRSDRWLDRAAGSAKPGKSTDEIMALTRSDD